MGDSSSDILSNIENGSELFKKLVSTSGILPLVTEDSYFKIELDDEEEDLPSTDSFLGDYASLFK